MARSVYEYVKPGIYASTNLPKGGIELVIESADYNEELEKVLIHFTDGGNALALNRGRVTELVRVAGPDMDKWPGVKVKLSVGKTTFKKKKVDCVVMEVIGRGKVPAKKTQRKRK